MVKKYASSDLLFFSPSINTIIYGKKNWSVVMHFLGQVREKKLHPIHDVAPCQHFSFI